MYCDTYCKGKSTEVTCSSLSGDDKEKCIKSCLDCRSPNKKFCYCPSIFPPKAGKGRTRLGDEETGTINDLLGEGEEENTDDTLFTVSIVVAVLLVAIGVAIFCLIRYNKRKKEAAAKSMPRDGKYQGGGPMRQQQMQMQSGRGGPGPYPDMNNTGRAAGYPPRSPRGRHAHQVENEDSDAPAQYT